MASIGTPAPAAGRGKATVGLAALVLLFSVLFVAGLLPKLHNQARLADAAHAQETGAMLVQTITPHFGSSSDVVLPGNIQAIEDTTVEARTSGYLSKRYVDIGYHVRKGQLLADIESPDVDAQVYQAQAQTAQSQATVGQSEANVAQQRANVSQMQSQVVQQSANVEQARAQLASTESKLTQAQASEGQAEAAFVHSQRSLDVQKAAQRQSQAQLDLATVTNQRYQTLLKEGYAAQQDADQSAAAQKTAAAAADSAQASVLSAQSDVHAADEAVAAAKAVVSSASADVLASRKSVMAAQAALGASRATVASAQASLTASMKNVQANRAAVNSNAANTRHYSVLRSFEHVVAPFDGVITSRNVDAGSLINAGSVSGTPDATTPRTGLFGIARTDFVRVDANVPESAVAAVKNDLPVELTVPEYPGRTFRGEVYQSAGALDSATRTLLAEVRVANGDGALKPGMYAQVRLMIHGRRALPRIAANALIVDADGTRVAEVTPGATVHFVPVEVGRDFGSEVEIVRGITGDERLITDPSDDLREGTAVEVKGKADGPVTP